MKMNELFIAEQLHLVPSYLITPIIVYPTGITLVQYKGNVEFLETVKGRSQHFLLKIIYTDSDSVVDHKHEHENIYQYRWFAYFDGKISIKDKYILATNKHTILKPYKFGLYAELDIEFSATLF